MNKFYVAFVNKKEPASKHDCMPNREVAIVCGKRMLLDNAQITVAVETFMMNDFGHKFLVLAEEKHVLPDGSIPYDPSFPHIVIYEDAT